MQSATSPQLLRQRRLRYALRVREATLREAYDLLARIPELHPLPTFDALQDQLRGSDTLCLLAEANWRPAACKIGYAKDGVTFCSLIGGVLPDFRRCGIGRTLLHEQEYFLSERGFRRVEVQPLLRAEAMLSLLESEHYMRIGVETSRMGQTLLYEKHLHPAPVRELQPL